MNTKKWKNRGFTLIELIIVVEMCIRDREICAIAMIYSE